MFSLKYRNPRDRFRLNRRSFDSVKAMTQYVRRNSITEFQYFYDDEPVTFFGNQMVSLSQLQARIKMLAVWLDD